MSQITALLTQTFSYAEPGALSASGDPTFGAVATAACRHEHGSFLVRSADGTERRATDKLATETDVSAAARVWLPGVSASDGNLSKQVISKTRASDPGASYTLVELFL